MGWGGGEGRRDFLWLPWAWPLAIFVGNKRKMRSKELPGCSVSHLLIANTWQLEILVTCPCVQLTVNKIQSKSWSILAHNIETYHLSDQLVQELFHCILLLSPYNLNTLSASLSPGKDQNIFTFNITKQTYCLARSIIATCRPVLLLI